MKKMSIALSVALVLGATAMCQAETPVASTLSAQIDTWIEGTVLTLDADGQKFTVRGLKLPFATAEAEMMAEIADKTKDLDATARQAKVQEIQASWADKLNKAKQQQVATSTSDFNFSLPDKANLVIMSEKTESAKASDPNQVIAGASSSSSSSVSVKDGVKTESAQATVETLPAKEISKDELTAVKSLKDLKIGDKVKVGFDAGLISNTAYVVLEGGTAIR